MKFYIISFYFYYYSLYLFIPSSLPSPSPIPHRHDCPNRQGLQTLNRLNLSLPFLHSSPSSLDPFDGFPGLVLEGGTLGQGAWWDIFTGVAWPILPFSLPFPHTQFPSAWEAGTLASAQAGRWSDLHPCQPSLSPMGGYLGILVNCVGRHFPTPELIHGEKKSLPYLFGTLRQAEDWVWRPLCGGKPQEILHSLLPKGILNFLAAACLLHTHTHTFLPFPIPTGGGWRGLGGFSGNVSVGASSQPSLACMQHGGGLPLLSLSLDLRGEQ